MRAYRFNCEAADAFAEGDFRRAENRARAALKHSQTETDRVTSLLNLVATLQVLKPSPEIETLAREALDLCLRSKDREVWSEEPRAWRQLGRCLQDQGRYPEALECRLRGLELERELLGESRVGSRLDLGDLYYAMHRNQESLAVYDEVEKRGVEGSKAATLAGNRATVLNRLGRHREAEALHREALRLEEEKSGPDHFELVVPLRNLASELVERAPRQALELLARARAIQTRCLGARHPDLASIILLEACCQERLGQSPFALHQQAIDLARDSPLELADCLDALACSLARARRHAEAWMPLRQAVELQAGLLEPAHPALIHTRINLADLLRKLGRLDEAEAELESLRGLVVAGKCRDLDAAIRLLQQARAIMEAFPEHAERRSTLLYLLAALRKANRAFEAEEVRSILERDFPDAL